MDPFTEKVNMDMMKINEGNKMREEGNKMREEGFKVLIGFKNSYILQFCSTNVWRPLFA